MSGREQAVVDGPGLARDGDGAWDAVLRGRRDRHDARGAGTGAGRRGTGAWRDPRGRGRGRRRRRAELGIDDYEAGDVGQVVADDEDLLEETVLLDGELDVDGRDLLTGARDDDFP